MIEKERDALVAIVEHWRQQGHPEVRAWIEERVTRDEGRQLRSDRVIRTNLVGGLPPGGGASRCALPLRRRQPRERRPLPPYAEAPAYRPPPGAPPSARPRRQHTVLRDWGAAFTPSRHHGGDVIQGDRQREAHARRILASLTPSIAREIS